MVDVVDEEVPGWPVAGPPDTPDADRPQPHWLIRAVPALIIALGLVAMAAAMLLAARSGINPADSKQVTIGPFDVLLVYSTPTTQLVFAGLATTLAMVILVNGLDAWAAKRATHPARRSRDVLTRPLRAEATPVRPAGPVSVTALIPGPKRRGPHRRNAGVATSSNRPADGRVGHC